MDYSPSRKKNLKVIEEGEEFVFKHKGFIPTGDVGGHARNIQYVTLEKGSKSFSVLNFHGLWTGKGKGDTDERIEQSKKILKLVDSLPSSFLISGDFNLSLKTKSVELLESHGMKNLIKDFNITSTRTSFYTRPEKFADYIFTSPKIKVIDFKVLPDEVSDHSPLYIEFDII